MEKEQIVEGPSHNKKSHAAVTQGGSAFQRYQDVIIGRRSLRTVVYYEWCMLLAIVPGALGLVLRKKFWPKIFGSCGKGVLFASNVIVRHPHRIHLGDNVVISENCVLDARNDEMERTIVIGEDAILSNNVIISCKGGTVRVGARTGVGAQTIIQSTNDCPVDIGEDVMIGPMCYMVGGGNYNIDRIDIPMRLQGIKKDSGVRLDDGVWLGAKVMVLGGVSMGHGSVAAGGAVVTKSVCSYAICGGLPAKVIRMRTEG